MRTYAKEPEAGSGSAQAETAIKGTDTAQRVLSEYKTGVAQLRLAGETVSSFAGQRVAAPAESSVEGKSRTGLPETLQANMEALSGYSMDDVTVHYNSSEPARIQAHAYTRGTDIHVAPGQEKHLAHEAWHVVQQKQGRVQPTRQLKGGVNINDNAALEREADTLGARASLAGVSRSTQRRPGIAKTAPHPSIQCTIMIENNNVNEDSVKKALLYGIKSREVGDEKVTKKYITKDALNAAGNAMAHDLFETYNTSRVTLRLKDDDSLCHQVSQDAYFYRTNNKGLIGTPHQFSEYSIDKGKRKPGHDDSDPVSARNAKDMRIYRAMPIFAWDQAKLWGHGGSIGEAMHYFEVYKRDTLNNPKHVFVLVEFRVADKTLNDMIGEIKAGGEGATSDDKKFGGKNESKSAFGLPKGFFSVDLKNAEKIFATLDVSSRVIASTGEMPEKKTKPGKAWSKGLANKPEDWQ